MEPVRAESASDVSILKEQPVTVTRPAGAPLTAIAEQQKARTIFTYAEGQKIMRKVDWHILPLFMLAYALKAMDQTAISYVKTMNPKKTTNILKQLHMTSDQFALCSTVFTAVLLAAEIPSTMMFKVSGPRIHYTRIILLWSISCACQAAAQNAGGLFATRALLGLFEAGLAPGLYVHLTYWYRPDEIGPRHAIITALYQFANIFNAFLSYGLSYVDGRHGISGWQWVFIIQGLTGIVFGAICYFYMPDYPENSPFLTEDERAWVVGRLPASCARGSDASWSTKEFKAALTDTTTMGFGLGLCLFQSGLLGYLFWLPTIIAGFGISSTATVQLMNIPPAFLYWVGGILGSLANDRFTSMPRGAMMQISCTIWAGLLLALTFTRNKGGLYAIVCLASVFNSWAFTTWMNWRAQALKGSTHAAYTIAFMNFSSQLPGLYTAQVFRSKYAPRYITPFMVCFGLTVASMVVVCWLWYATKEVDRETRRIAALRRKIGRRDNIVIEEDAEFDEEVMHRNDNRSEKN